MRLDILNRLGVITSVSVTDRQTDSGYLDRSSERCSHVSVERRVLVWVAKLYCAAPIRRQVVDLAGVELE